jgi:hypothetical protein
MVQVASHLAVDPWIRELSAEHRRRPVVIQFASLALEWERRADEALGRDEWEWAAACQERAAIAAHRLGLLEEAMLEISLRRHTKAVTSEPL